jgi:hypothetical protein
LAASCHTSQWPVVKNSITPENAIARKSVTSAFNWMVMNVSAFWVSAFSPEANTRQSAIVKKK